MKKTIDVRQRLLIKPTRRLLLVISTGALWLGPGTTFADDLFSVRKARRRITPICSLPVADYQHGARSPSIVVRSLPALNQLSAANVSEVLSRLRAAQSEIEMLDRLQASQPEMVEQLKAARRIEAEQAIDQATRPKAKLMQLATSDLTIAHCRVSDLALQIEPTGMWHLSLRGDQNYVRPTQSRQRNVDLQLKRNAFKVNIRLLRSSRRVEELVTDSLTNQPNFEQAGKLAFAEINVPEFWVQREAPQFITKSGYSEMIATHFDDIDQAEFEFFIRLDPLTGSGHGVVAPWQQEP